MSGLAKVSCSLVSLLIMLESAQAGGGLSWWHRHDRHHHRERDQAWWKGPNVCVTTRGNSSAAEVAGRESALDVLRDATEVSYMYYYYRFFVRQKRGRGERNFLCEELPDNSRKCETSTMKAGGGRGGRRSRVKVSKTYSCCYGYSRSEGDFGCPTKLELQNLLETAANLGATSFLKLIELTELYSLLNSGNYTVFIPTNKALDHFFLVENSTSQSAPKPRPTLGSTILSDDVSSDISEDTLYGHVVTGFKQTTSFFNEELLETIASEGINIRINLDSSRRRNKIITANCVVLNSIDNLATDGVVHMVDKVIHPAKDSLFNIVLNDPRFTYLANAIKRAGFEEMLKRGPYTILAPDDEAFLKMSQATLNSVLYDEKRLTALLKHHILPATLCSAAACPGTQTKKSLLGEDIRLTNENGTLSFGGAKVIEQDIVATNGVIQVIDQVILTDKALTVADVLEPSLSELVKDAGIDGIFGSLTNITLFAPSNEAIESLPEELRTDPGALRRALMYHVLSEEYSVHQLKKDSPSTLYAFNEKDKLNINTACSSPYLHYYHRMCMLNVQCVPIADGDRKVSNGRVHIINEFLQPPTMTLLELVKANDSFSTLLKLIEAAGMAEELESSEEPLTLLAPTDNDYRSYGDKLDALLNDPEMARATLNRYIIRGHKCCANFHRNWWWADKPMIRGARVDQCDIAATNGVLHVLGSAIRAF